MNFWWQTLLEAKNKEIEELKEDFKRRDAELDKRLAAVETTKAESADVISQHCLRLNVVMSNYPLVDLNVMFPIERPLVIWKLSDNNLGLWGWMVIRG